ncbi:hypothetical protein CHUAL_003366 [Chamberlinius hualienensis]
MIINCAFSISFLMIAIVPAADFSQFAYVGTYGPPNGVGVGIYVHQINQSDGSWSIIQTMVTASPSFFRFNANKNRLHVVNELTEVDGENGTVSTFSVDLATGLLTFLTSQSSSGNSPCHLNLDSEEKYLVAVNYNNGSVVTFGINEDGTVGTQTDIITHHGSGPNPDRQAGPHTHMVYFVQPVNGRPNLHVVDLGLDRVFQYEFDNQTGQIKQDVVTASWAANPGAGPRHTVIPSTGKFLYVINEIDSTLSVYLYELAQNVTPIQTVSTLPSGWVGQSTAGEIAIHSSEKFIYGSNRGHDSIAIFLVDSDTGYLALVGHEPTQGKTPRHFLIEGDYLYVANQDSNSVYKFQINIETGTLTNLGQLADVPNPVCIGLL